MRKHSLRQEANLYLQSNKGSPRERKYRRYVILKMIDGLFITGKVPPQWKAINSTHIQLLVNHWHKQKIKPSTMMNYMTIIRKFLADIGNCSTDIDNLSLGITVKKSTKKAIKITLERWQQISDPTAKLLLNLQIHFGLTLGEAMRLIPDVHVQKNKLWLTREITFNCMDRIIPIRTEVQANIVNEFNLLTKNQHTLIETHGYRALCFTWSKALKTLRIPAKKSCRYLYAQLTYQQLTPTLGKDELTKLLMSELGLKSPTTLWGYLQKADGFQIKRLPDLCGIPLAHQSSICNLNDSMPTLPFSRSCSSSTDNK